MLTKKHIPHCEGEREGRKLPPHTLKGLTKLTKNSKSQAEDTTGRVRLCLHVQSLPDLVCRTAAISALGFCIFFCPGLGFFPSCPGVVAFLRIACICVTIKHSPSCCCRRFLRHYPPLPLSPLFPLSLPLCATPASKCKICECYRLNYYYESQGDGCPHWFAILSLHLPDST